MHKNALTVLVMTSTATDPFRVRTAKEQRVDHQLKTAGEPSLETFVKRRRAANESWPDIAFHLRSITGIAVPEQTLRRWLASTLD